MKKPVYKLVKGDTFCEDGIKWVIDSVIQPSDWTSLNQVNSPGKNWEIQAHANGQRNQRFYFSGTKVLTLVG